MTRKKLVLGNEAVALGAIHAGISGVYAYPGTPSTEITEYIQNDVYARENKIRSKWCTNEKTAMEAALGMSFSGKRALVCMKHVGMNVCADPFINSAVSGINGGVVVLSADDPSMHSSQNEQDSRFYAKFAMIPCFEPSNQQEAYDMTQKAFDLSEELKVPVLLRLVTRLAHSRAAVSVSETRPQNEFNPSTGRDWILLPANSRRLYDKLIAKQPLMVEASNSSGYNKIEKVAGKGTGVIACGIAYNYVKECNPQNISAILKVSQYPVDPAMVKELADMSSDIIVVEDGQPQIENDVKAVLSADYSVKGRLTGDLPRAGELNPDKVAAAFGIASSQLFSAPDFVENRFPQMCVGCGHRDVYTALNKVLEEFPGAKVFGDIGCYTLGANPPFFTLNSTIDMGASITMAKGAADAGQYPSIAVIGDSTFTHSGMTGLLDAVNENADITVIISDNLTTAMTGGQDSAGTNKFEQICIGLGVDPDHIKVVVPIPQNIESITNIIKEEINYHGVSVIIPRRECMQTLRRHSKAKKN